MRVSAGQPLGHHAAMNEDTAEPVEIPVAELSDAALRGLVEAFVLREGTDYGDLQHSLADKVDQVIRQLTNNKARILFDPSSESVDIVVVNDKSTTGGRERQPFSNQ